MMHIRTWTFVAALAFFGLAGMAIGNGITTTQKIEGTQEALMRQCDHQVTKAVGRERARWKRIFSVPF